MGGFTVGVITSDPNLLRCELARLRGELVLGDTDTEPLGAGWYADENVLLQRYSARARPEALELLGGVMESEALIAHGGPLPLGLSLEENSPPFRYRQWLFAGQGQVGGAERFRRRALEVLPDHLVRQVKGCTLQELWFAMFLAALRQTGRTDDAKLESRVVADALGRTVRDVEQLAAEAGARLSGLAMVATNNRTLGAARLGEQPVYIRLLEGAPQCEVCRLDGSSEAEPNLRAHLRRRTVVVATRVRDPRQWLELESRQALGVDRELNVEKVGL